MVLKSGREKGIILYASIFTGVLLVLGVCLASASTWNPSAGFFGENCLCSFLNALKIAEEAVVYGEVPRARLYDRVFSASQFCMGASSNLKLFEDRSECVLYAGIPGAIFEKPEPNGTDMVSLE